MRQPITLRCTPPAEGPTLSLLAATIFSSASVLAALSRSYLRGVLFTHAVFVHTQNVYRIVTS